MKRRVLSKRSLEVQVDLIICMLREYREEIASRIQGHSGPESSVAILEHILAEVDGMILESRFSDYDDNK